MAPHPQAQGAVVIRLADYRPRRAGARTERARTELWIAVLLALAIAAALLGMARPFPARASGAERDDLTLPD